MREILFRAKRADDGAWEFGWFEKCSFGRWPLKCSIIPSDDAEDGYYHHVMVSPETVGQFTGLTDKNGTKIFEGDIIAHHAQGDIIVNRGAVVWDARDGRWAYQLHTMQPGFYMHNPEAVEIIGNIHDNPELLEE